jgi:hypothetical protein
MVCLRKKKSGMLPEQKDSFGCSKRQKRNMTRVGFEPTHLAIPAPEAGALDRSAILPDVMIDERL